MHPPYFKRYETFFRMFVLFKMLLLQKTCTDKLSMIGDWRRKKSPILYFCLILECVSWKCLKLSLNIHCLHLPVEQEMLIPLCWIRIVNAINVQMTYYRDTRIIRMRGFYFTKYDLFRCCHRYEIIVFERFQNTMLL